MLRNKNNSITILSWMDDDILLWVQSGYGLIFIITYDIVSKLFFLWIQHFVTNNWCVRDLPHLKQN